MRKLMVRNIITNQHKNTSIRKNNQIINSMCCLSKRCIKVMHDIILMLGNLQELQYNLSFLIQQFAQIRTRLVSPLQAKSHNQKTLLIKLPKIILIIRIFPYLDYSDIISLSTTSTALRKAIFSPIGWKLINRTCSPYPILIREISNEEFRYKGNDYAEMDELHYTLPEDEKNLRKSRLQCKKELMQLYEKFKLKEQEFNELQKKLKSERTQIKKLSMQKQFLQKNQLFLHEENMAYKNELKSVNIGFNDKIKQLDQENEALMEENNKLQNQKGALVNKIREYQNQIEVIKSESEKSKAILKRIKNYLLYKEL